MITLEHPSLGKTLSRPSTHRELHWDGLSPDRPSSELNELYYVKDLINSNKSNG